MTQKILLFLLLVFHPGIHTHTYGAPKRLQQCTIFSHRIRLLQQILPCLIGNSDTILKEKVHKRDTWQLLAVVARIAKAADVVEQRVIIYIELHGHPIRRTNDFKKISMGINLQ